LPPDPSIVAKLDGDAAAQDSDSIFPPGQEFKSLYAIYALKAQLPLLMRLIRAQAKDETPDLRARRRLVQIISVVAGAISKINTTEMRAPSSNGVRVFRRELLALFRSLIDGQ
jgi:hypothetical protein